MKQLLNRYIKSKDNIEGGLELDSGLVDGVVVDKLRDSQRQQEYSSGAIEITEMEVDDGFNEEGTMGKFILPTIEGIEFVNYVNEEQLDDVMRLVGQDLSEPYSSEFCYIILCSFTHSL